MATKKITVKNLLALMDEAQEVTAAFFAYGILYALSTDSGRTAADLLENMRKDCLNAEVASICTVDGKLYIYASITK